jgi:pimeloyl-ACP methyl ester carboxylesterase
MTGARENVPDLPAALAGERRVMESPAGRLSYYVDGAGPPLLLVHSINAAGSAYEVKPVYERYRASRTVYALDLPGFGFSDRAPRDYTPRLMTDAVHAMTREILRRHGEGPIDALALSLASEFLARAASESPGAFRSLALVSPTGFSGDTPRDGPSGSTLGNATLYRVLTFPLWRQGIFSALTSLPSIRYFLRKTWGSADIDEGMVAYDYLTTHQPGASNAPYRFVAGYLFSNDISRIYDGLAMPVFMAHGVRGDFQDYRRKSSIAGKANWTVRVFDTGALPYFERPQEFAREYDAFLGRL